MKRFRLFQFYRIQQLPQGFREAILAYLEHSDSENDPSGTADSISDFLEDLPQAEGIGTIFHNKDSFLNMEHSWEDPAAVFVSAHHLGTKEIHRLLTKAAWERSAISIYTRRERPTTNLLRSIATPFRAAQFFIGHLPASFGVILFSTLIPVLPLAAAWDRFAGQLGAYSSTEFREIGEHIHVPGFRFRSGRIVEKGRAEIHYLIGTPELRKAA
jgi:hypothetical protein